jgi:signal transduction histidine kinase
LICSGIYRKIDDTIAASSKHQMNTPENPGIGAAGEARIRDSSSAPDHVSPTELDRLVTERTAELAALATHLQAAAESERSALAKELHDELGGLITAAKMDMAWLTAHIGGKLDPAGEEKFRSVVQMLNQAMTLKRRVVESLRPSLLDHFGLPVALRSHFDENCTRVGIEYIATLPEETIDLDPTTQLALFRIAQQALISVIARNARHVELVLEAAGDGYTMLVGDDGAATIDAGLEAALFGMRHRIKDTGGILETEQMPGQGNRIRVFVPRSPAKSG